MSMIYIFLIVFIYYVFNLQDDKCLLKMVAMGCVVFLLNQNRVFEASENNPTPEPPIDKPKSSMEKPKPSNSRKYVKPDNQSYDTNKKVKTRTLDGTLEDMVGENVHSTNMSKYDGLCIRNDNEEGWMKFPDNIPLIKDKDLYVIQGHTNPNEPIPVDSSNINGPPVDGDIDGTKSMFMFKNNVVSPLCCPSTFTTSDGCVCSTKKQRDYINNRGYGNSIPCSSSD